MEDKHHHPENDPAYKGLKVQSGVASAPPIVNPHFRRRRLPELSVEQYVEAHNGVSKRVFVVGLVAQELQSWLMEQSPDEVQDQEFGPDQDEQGFGMSMTM